MDVVKLGKKIRGAAWRLLRAEYARKTDRKKKLLLQTTFASIDKLFRLRSSQ